MKTLLRHLYRSLLLSLLIIQASAQVITGTEAVEYDPTGNRFLITNQASILQQHSGSDIITTFGEGEADYGMEVIGNTLYTISGAGAQLIKGYDLTTTEEVMNISGFSGFLNGMASDPSTNRLWITNFSSNQIIEIDATDLTTPTITYVVTNTVCTPNGITHDAVNNRLVYVCWSGGNIQSVDLDDYTVSTLVNTNLSNMDGIDHDFNGNFYVSSWSPTRITKFSSDFEAEEMITAPGLSNPADISYAVEIDSLAIANSGNNSVTYINFGDIDGIDELSTDNPITIFPNPISNSSYLEFEVTTATMCTVRILDGEGRETKVLMAEKIQPGSQKILFSGIELARGVYICEIRTDEGIWTETMIAR